VSGEDIIDAEDVAPVVEVAREEAQAVRAAYRAARLVFFYRATWNVAMVGAVTALAWTVWGRVGGLVALVAMLMLWQPSAPE
jgi:hypothetical protein